MRFKSFHFGVNVFIIPIISPSITYKLQKGGKKEKKNKPPEFSSL